MADTDIVQVIAEARVDARSLSEFVFKPASFMVTRRLAPSINTLNYYLDRFNAVTVSANNSISSANALIADANTKILAADGVVADAYAGAEQRFFDTANNNLNSQIDVYLSAQDIGKSVFDTPQAGITAGIANGSYYSVRSTDSDYFLEEYKNNAGTPQATGKKYPAAKFLLTKGVFTVSELLILGATATAGARFNTHGFYTKGDCLPSVFEVQTVAVGDVFTDIGNGTLIGSDASIKINSTKKLKLMADNSVALSQLGGVKTAQSVTIKNDVIGSVILKNYKRLIIDGFYTLRGTLWHYENNVICGIGKKVSGIRMGDNVNKYPIQSVNSNIKASVILNESLEISDFTLDGNESKNNIRDYTQDINLTYWGFGAALFNINELYVHNVHVKDTNAWGISYFLCNIVIADNVTFDQKVELGGNKDGITGSGKRVTYKNLSGYTSDDLCAVTTGKSSLQSHDCGVTATQDIEYIDLSNVEGLDKSGTGTHYAVGIYGSDATKIKKVTLSDVKGSFRDGMLRFSNYWYVSEKLSVGSVEIDGVNISNVSAGKKIGLYFKHVSIDRLTINEMTYAKTGDTLTGTATPIVLLETTYINTLAVRKLTVRQASSVQNIAVLVGGVGTEVKNLYFDDVSGISKEIIADDTNINVGCMTLFDGNRSPIDVLDVKNISFNQFKSIGHASNMSYLSTFVLKSQRVDFMSYQNNSTTSVTSYGEVSIISSELKLLNSVYYLNIVADITVTSIDNDKNCFKFTSFSNIKKQSITMYAAKATSNGANMLFKQQGDTIVLVAPKFTGVTAPGIYRAYGSFAIPLA